MRRMVLVGILVVLVINWYKPVACAIQFPTERGFSGYSHTIGISNSAENDKWSVFYSHLRHIADADLLWLKTDFASLSRFHGDIDGFGIPSRLIGAFHWKAISKRHEFIYAADSSGLTADVDSIEESFKKSFLQVVSGIHGSGSIQNLGPRYNHTADEYFWSVSKLNGLSCERNGSLSKSVLTLNGNEYEDRDEYVSGGKNNHKPVGNLWFLPFAFLFSCGIWASCSTGRLLLNDGGYVRATIGVLGSWSLLFAALSSLMLWYCGY